MALELLRACCSLWKTHVRVSYFIPPRPPTGVLPTITAQIYLKHLWIISIWLIIHGPACWAAVNKVTLFFIWLHSGSHGSGLHNDRSSRGKVVPALPSVQNIDSVCVQAVIPSRMQVSSLVLEGFFFSTVQRFQGHDSFPVRCQKCIADAGRGAKTDASQLFAAPLVDLSAIDSQLRVSQSLGGPVCLHTAIQSWNEPWGA